MSITEFRTRFTDIKVIKSNDCFMVIERYLTKFGHVSCNRWTNHGLMTNLHRYIYSKLIGDPTGKVIRHKCDNPSCVNPLHLVAGTHADNVADRVKRGRSAKGVKNGRSKLTKEQVLFIYKDNVSTKTELAKLHGVDIKVVSKIKDGRNWSHVTGHK